MFKRKYEPHVKGDKVKIVDNRLSGIFLFVLVVFIILGAMLVLSGTDDLGPVCIIVGFFLAALWLFFEALERRYTITPEYISVRYGLFSKKVRFEDVDYCFFSSNSFITLYDLKGKETTIDLIHMNGDYENYFLDAIRNGNVQIRAVGSFEKNANGRAIDSNFNMSQKGFIFSIILFMFFMLIISVPLFCVALDSEEEIVGRVFMLVIALLNVLLWGFLATKVSETITINNDTIIIKRWFKKSIVLNVNDIDWVYTGMEHYSNRGGGYDIEEMQIHVNNELLKLSTNISRGFKNYDVFIAYLQDHRVPFSLDKTKLITYEKVEEDSKKDIPELLNLEEHSFTCNEDYIIENGPFAGMKLDKDLEANGDYTKFFKKHIFFDKIRMGFVWIMYIAFFVAMIAARVGVINIFMALLIPGTLFMLAFVIKAIDEKSVVNEILKNARCYEAVLFTADVRENDEDVYFAYKDGDCVRLIEPFNTNGKSKQQDYEARYGVPTYIWADPQNIPFCLEGDTTGPKNLGRFTRNIVTAVIGLVAGLFFLGMAWLVTSDFITGGSTDYEVEENANIDQLLVDYNDNEMLRFEYQDSEKNSSVYKFSTDVTSFYAYSEDGETYAVGGHYFQAYLWDDTEDFLENAWGITDMDTAHETIDDMLTYGHRAKFRSYVENDEDTQKAIEAIERDYGDSFTFEDAVNIDEDYFEENDISTDEFYRVKGAACAYVRFGEDGMTAYDYIRLMRVVALSYNVRYLSAEDYMQLLYNMATVLQQEYSSFADIHECYYYGEMFRLGEVNDDNEAIILDDESVIKEMRMDDFYSSIEPDYNLPITEDWHDLIIDRSK
ncbi:MAG: DUF1266 domain-containing protein [Pseudobutyrivibrio sp.]|nr:DUF1266 domain-containing protein [Pseudobutyrivibrio sp.]